MEPLSRFARGGALAVLLTLACTGNVEDTPAAPGGRLQAPQGAVPPSSDAPPLDGKSGAGAPSDPGFVTARRLNRTEYNNTVRDLLGTALKPADEFPADDLGGGFDTVGSALSLSPAYVLAYERAAHALIDELLTDTSRRRNVVSCDVASGDACARTVLGAFARKAFRRPVTDEELGSLLRPLAVAREVGASPEEGLAHALAAVLISPHFLFKLELDPAATPSRRLRPHELATRLSYALWSSMPDAALQAAADAGELTSDAQIGAQIDRMLADPRADTLLDTFAAQWLDYANLSAHEVERSVFPRYTPQLARSMQREARRFLQEFLRSSLPVRELLSARFTFVDATLAGHYGLPAPSGGSGDALVRVDTSQVSRVGLLTLGAFLTTTSFSARTSPVKRGDFVYKQLLCGSIAAPPPDVPALPEGMDSLSLRERLEQHRKNPSCAGCHRIMDPLGFGLENYDAIGAHRTQDKGAPIDASGMLPDGTSFNGALELSAVLASDPRFPRCVTEKFMTFALGRLLDQPEDERWISELSARAEAAGGSLRSILRTVLLSEPFLSRKSKT